MLQAGGKWLLGRYFCFVVRKGKSRKTVIPEETPGQEKKKEKGKIWIIRNR
jgi:hypothetical protein